MSDTRRWVQPGWDAPWCKSKKHQSRDRRSTRQKGGKFYRFIKGVKNHTYNLHMKIDQLRFKEEIES